MEPIDYRTQSPAVRERFERLKAREVILETRDLGKTYRSTQGEVTALRGVNLQVRRREFLCVIGPSGCGKSTLIRMLAGQFGKAVKAGGKQGETLTERAQLGTKPVQARLWQQRLSLTRLHNRKKFQEPFW